MRTTQRVTSVFFYKQVILGDSSAILIFFKFDLKFVSFLLPVKKIHRRGAEHEDAD